MTWRIERQFWGMAAAWACLAYPAQAQAPVGGNGLLATYYDGENFERAVVSRHDAQLNFDWAMRPPAPGVPAQYFSVRWLGWLVPPTTGRYVFHVAVDDGMRIWLNNRLVLDEWRLQPLQHYSFAVELKAGQPYRLRVEYFQDILDTRASLTWEPPKPIEPPASWRNFWGLQKEDLTAIPTRFLFTTNPIPVVALSGLTVRPATKAVAAAPTRRVAPPAPAAARPQVATQRPTTVSPPNPKLIAPVPVPPVPTLPDTSGTSRLARLTEGAAVTLSELHFEQSQARLLPKARQALDKLAAALAQRPTLRLEVQGHTDNQGSAELNRQLSQQRADVVCLYLSAHGVAAGRLLPKGYGGTQPIADNNDPAQRPRNRRVVLVPQP